MPKTPSIIELKKAFQILFNNDGYTETDHFTIPDLSRLQKAFRQKALETHPDRSKLLGKNETEMVRRFNEVTTAFELLKPLVQNGDYFSWSDQTKVKERQTPSSIRKKTPPSPMNTQGENSRETKRPKSHYYKGALPRFEMTVNQFLYYSGIIPWKTYIEANVWENKKCPRFGQIARRWHILTAVDVREILKEKTCHEKFGEFALRTGYLTVFQQMAIAGRQRILKPPPGLYFLEKGLFSPDQIDRIHERILLRNRELRQMNRH